MAEIQANALEEVVSGGWGGWQIDWVDLLPQEGIPRPQADKQPARDNTPETMHLTIEVEWRSGKAMKPGGWKIAPRFCQAITGADGLHGTDMGTKNQGKK